MPFGVGPPIDHRNPPAARIQTQHVLELVDRRKRPGREGHQLVADLQAAPLGIARDHRLDDHLAQSAFVGLALHQGPQSGVVCVQPHPQLTQEVLDLVDRDGVADSRVDPAALLERAPAIDADQLAGHVEQRAARVARVDRGVDLDAVGVLQQGAGRVLVAMHSADQAEGHGRSEVGGQHERVAQGQRPVARLDLVAVSHPGVGELVARLLGQQLDQGHVADLVQPDQDGVIEHAIGQTALQQRRAGRVGDVEVGQGVTFLVDQDSRAAAGDDGHHGRLDLLDHGDAFLLGLDHTLVQALAGHQCGGQCDQPAGQQKCQPSAWSVLAHGVPFVLPFSGFLPLAA